MLARTTLPRWGQLPIDVVIRLCGRVQEHHLGPAASLLRQWPQSSLIDLTPQGNNHQDRPILTRGLFEARIPARA
jgi:hypothetical protein